MGEPWFGVKTYGIGLSPKGPAGWLAVLVFVLVIVGASAALRHFAAPAWMLLAVDGAICVGFLVLVFAKSDGEPWRWRWGGR